MKITEIYAKLDAVLESQTDSKYDYICHEFPLETKTPFSICKFLNFCRHIKNVKLKDIKNENNESLECSVYITKEEQFLALGQVLCPIASKNISTTAHFEDYFRKLLKKSPQNSVFIAALAFSPEDLPEKQWKPWGNAYLQLPQIALHIKDKKIILKIHNSKKSPLKKGRETLGSHKNILLLLQKFLDSDTEIDQQAENLGNTNNTGNTENSHTIKNIFFEHLKEHYRSAVAHATELMQDKQQPLKKVVLAEEFRIADPHNEYFVEDFIKEQEALFLGEQSFALIPNYRKQETFFCGVSPETLYKKQGNTLKTEALAGTIAQQHTIAAPKNSIYSEQEKEFLSSAKDLEEHYYVRDYIVDALRAICETIDYTNKPTLKKLSRLTHLNTPITAKLISKNHTSLENQQQEISILSRLHPTPAVCGFPKTDALHFIENNESQPRGLYSGVFGVISHQKEHFSVNLRACYKHHKILSIFAGAGLVQDSNPELEWQEIIKKQASVFLKGHTDD